MRQDVGIITVDGRQVGTISLTSGADDFAADLGEPLSGHPVGFEPTARNRHHVGHHQETPEEHRHNSIRYGHHHSAQQQDAGAIPYSSTGNPFDRARFAKELRDKPALEEKIHQLAAGEDRPSNGESRRANMAVMETMMNRAVVRGTDLESQAKWYGRERGGYYAGKPSHLSEQERANSEENLRNVLAGSNITGYATDNSSQGLAEREKASGSFLHHTTINRESFFSPGHAEPAFRDRWRQLNDRAQAFERSKTTDTAAAKAFDPETEAP